VVNKESGARVKKSKGTSVLGRPKGLRNTPGGESWGGVGAKGERRVEANWGENVGGGTKS